MKQSQDQVKKAILVIGKYLNGEMGEKCYKGIMDSPNGHLPEMVKIVVYDLFTNKIEQYYVKEDEVFEAITLVREYAIELQKQGFVKFDEPFDSDEYIKIKQ